MILMFHLHSIRRDEAIENLPFLTLPLKGERKDSTMIF